jgi:hypothetical protein
MSDCVCVQCVICCFPALHAHECKQLAACRGIMKFLQVITVVWLDETKCVGPQLAGVANDSKGFVGEGVSVRCLLDGR